ncbi:MAG: nucleotidyl transferase AbiEii/AbiGii toxin family protein [Bacteroidetes bacterium]|nr:nucleotidyl transferase AbiEii/AbiGii toxin family protein [Bacteroidota bacterium]MBS1540184.1 nucleotidyl transferase AbiEii/AbiGii toxin family protein [Bacteroidota bacterium]
MLHKDPFIVKPETFRLIQQLQSLPNLKEFNLVGGTALALQLNHRNSIDIDLFTQNEFENDVIIDYVKSYSFGFDVLYNFKNTIIGYINKIKVDFITHPYPFVHPPISEEGITYLSLQDIAAMKLNAISNSCKRLKDFIDISFLLEHFSLNEMIGFYSLKYPHFNPMIPLRAINYFEDIDPAIDPPQMKTKITLSQIKKTDY